MKKNIKLLFILAFLQGMVFYASISTLYRQASHLSLTEIGIIEAISLLFSLSLEIPWGVLADRIGYKRTMVICSIFYFLSKVVFYRADCFGLFLLERFLLSIALAGISGVDSAMLYSSVDKKESQKVFGIYYHLGNFGLMLSSLIYSLYFKGNYRLSAFATCVPFFIAMILSFFLEEVEHVPLEHSFKDLLCIIAEPLKEKRILLFLIGSGLLMEASHEITAFLNQLFYMQAGIPKSLFGLIHIFMTSLGFLSVLSGTLTHKMGRVSFLRLLVLLSMISCFLLMQFQAGGICILSIALLELVSALFYPFFQTIQNERVRFQQRATQLSVFMIMLEGVQMAVDVSIFQAAESSLNHAMILGMILCLIGGILIIRNAEPQP